MKYLIKSINLRIKVTYGRDCFIQPSRRVQPDNHQQLQEQLGKSPKLPGWQGHGGADREGAPGIARVAVENRNSQLNAAIG